VIQAVDVAAVVTVKSVFLQDEVSDVKVLAKSEFDRKGICSLVCICLRKQSSHVTVDATFHINYQSFYMHFVSH
jgi:hypothetical protein